MSLGLIGLASLALATPALAAPFDFQKVVVTGDVAPGLPAGTQFQQFYGNSLNGSGDIVFSSFVSGPSIGPDDDQLIYRAPSGGALAPLVRQGDPALGAAPGVVYGIPGPAVQNDAGDFAFSPHLGDGSSSWGALYIPGVSAPTLFASEGEAVPGGGGATWNGFTHLIAPVIDANGAVAFQANLSGSGFGSSIWGPDAGGTPMLVAREGDSAPGFAAGIEYDDMISAPLLNDSGRLAFAGTLGGSGGGESVLWLRDGTATPSALVRGTASAPDLGVGESFGSLSLLELNDSGRVIFHSFIDGVGVSDVNDGGLWRADGVGDPTLLAREGDAAPGAGTGVLFAGVWSGALAENGRLIFAADLTGAGISGQNDRALYQVDGSDALDLILQSGDAAPDLAGLVIADLPYEPLVDAAGNFLFRAELGGAGVTGDNDLAIFYYDALSDELVFVVREGDSLDVAPGDTRTIGTLFGPDLNDADQMSLMVSFVGGGQGIFLAAIPEPATGLLLALGCAGLAAARRRSPGSSRT